MNPMPHIGVLLLMIIFTNTFELFKGQYQECKWHTPTIAGILFWLILEAMFWIIVLFFN